MYKVEYFKNKSMADINDNKSTMIKFYPSSKELYDICCSIKSVTIDIDDLYYSFFNNKLVYLQSLYWKVKRCDTDGCKTLTIMNSNHSNSLCIYEILNFEWFLNKDDLDKSDELIIEKIRDINSLIEKYESSGKSSDEIRNLLKDKLVLFKFFVNSFCNADTDKNDDLYYLKYNKQFVKKRTSN